MIDWDDYPIRTPQQRLARAKRALGVKSMAEFEQEAIKNKERHNHLFEKYIVQRKSIDVKSMSIEALLDRFEEICMVESELQHDMFDEGVKKFNQCQDALFRVLDELKARGPDARRMLSRFYTHFNDFIRLKAATLSYRVAPEPARRVLEELKKMEPIDEAYVAGATLARIDNGTSMLE